VGVAHPPLELTKWLWAPRTGHASPLPPARRPRRHT
jgi:hypothetical protein